VCQGKAIQFDRVDFSKYCDPENYYEFGISGIAIDYFRCLFCGFVFTEDFDDWDHDEFARLIYNADYLKVDGEYASIRPRWVAKDFADRLRGCEHARILDYGSGAGVFAEQMRAYGFRNIEACDPFSSPQRPSGTFDIVTCFEVIEHSPDPVGTVRDMRRYMCDDGCIIFSQTVHPPDILSVRGSWWYLAPRNGHISTYSEESLAELARRHALVFHRGGPVYAFAARCPSSFATSALSTVGPSFTTLRLLAPRLLAEQAIAFPSRDEIYWHPEETDGIWRYRWTGAKSIVWDGNWGPVSALQIRIATVREVEPGFADRCELEVGGERKPVRRDRGELIAEFDVRDRASGQITLHTPDPVYAPGGTSQGPHGLAILLTQSPCWPNGTCGNAEPLAG
jgi:2-polyprenyl-6-hydroxyphenyl methylase/3-demethylubiquinone-9 3-methyltransferase